MAPKVTAFAAARDRFLFNYIDFNMCVSGSCQIRFLGSSRLNKTGTDNNPEMQVIEDGAKI